MHAKLLINMKTDRQEPSVQTGLTASATLISFLEPIPKAFGFSLVPIKIPVAKKKKMKLALGL